MNKKPDGKQEEKARIARENKKTDVKKWQSSASTSSSIAKVLAESQSKKDKEKK